MAYNLVERVRENIEHNIISYEGNEIKITYSIGLAKFEKADTLETSLKKADKAMYAVKKTGGNGVKAYNDSVESTVNV
jgi:diguanylate cyclase (GGDEF)-like protein